MIKIVNDGVVGVRMGSRLMPKTCNDEAFEIDSDTESMLVADGIAVFVDADDVDAADFEPETDDEGNDGEQIEPETDDEGTESAEDVEAEKDADSAGKQQSGTRKRNKTGNSRRKRAATDGSDAKPPTISATGIVE